LNIVRKIYKQILAFFPRLIIALYHNSQQAHNIATTLQIRCENIAMEKQRSNNVAWATLF